MNWQIYKRKIHMVNLKKKKKSYPVFLSYLHVQPREASDINNNEREFQVRKPVSSWLMEAMCPWQKSHSQGLQSVPTACPGVPATPMTAHPQEFFNKSFPKTIPQSASLIISLWWSVEWPRVGLGSKSIITFYFWKQKAHLLLGS